MTNLRFNHMLIQKTKKTHKRKNSYNTIFDSIYTKNKDNLLVKYLKGEKQEIIEKNNTPILLSESNISQRCAINNAINNDISIIQGPPGTGKTTTILSLIANFIMNGQNVVVVSKNNSAVDNIVTEFDESPLPEFYLRFGSDPVMKELYLQINDKTNKLYSDLNKINITPDRIGRLIHLKDELALLEQEIDDLIDLKNLIIELKTQKKFVDRKLQIYNYSANVNQDETKIICDKHANIKTITRLIRLANKNKYNFFEKLIIKYLYCIKQGDKKIKLISILHLLEEYYINKEIALKEEILIKGDLEAKQNKVKNLYKEYTNLCIEAFKSYLKQNMKVPISNINSQDELLKLVFNPYPLILTTADAFLYNFQNFMTLNKTIDCLIIDEASQCDVLTGLPLLYLTKKIVVVGDSKQLSAITNVTVKCDLKSGYRYDDNSFLESVKNVFNPVEKTLQEHYRCDFNIINFCNKYYYDNELKIYKSSKEDAISIVNCDKYKGAEKKNRAIINNREIKTINGLSKSDDTFVITPFKGQAEILEKEYGKKSAGTIHCFQGKGAKDVIFSTVLNDLNFCNRHIKIKYNMFSSELVNVAVSRAKDKFILVTDVKYFMKNKKYVPDINNLINYISIYGKEIEDETSCIFDYLYKNIHYYKSTALFDNEYEEELFKFVKQILENTDYICYAKLFLADLVQNEKFLNARPDIKEYIKNKAHADITIIDNRINKPVLVIELDGKDHENEIQKRRDAYKDEALRACNINILRIPSKAAYDLNDLKEKIFDNIIS